MTEPDAADVYIVNATPCSAGTGPGYATLPWDEAKALVDQGLCGVRRSATDGRRRQLTGR